MLVFIIIIIIIIIIKSIYVYLYAVCLWGGTLKQCVYVCVSAVQAVGYSCIPGNKDEDGLVALCLNKREADVRAQQQHLVESLFKLLGSNQSLSVNVEGVKALPDDQ